LFAYLNISAAPLFKENMGSHEFLHIAAYSNSNAHLCYPCWNTSMSIKPYKYTTLMLWTSRQHHFTTHKVLWWTSTRLIVTEKTVAAAKRSVCGFTVETVTRRHGNRGSGWDAFAAGGGGALQGGYINTKYRVFPECNQVVFMSDSSPRLKERESKTTLVLCGNQSPVFLFNPLIMMLYSRPGLRRWITQSICTLVYCLLLCLSVFLYFTALNHDA